MKLIYSILLVILFSITITQSFAFLPLEPPPIIIQNGQATVTGKQGSLNTTQANNANVNVGAYKLNFINGTGNPVNVATSHSGTQVNVTISSSGGGVTSLNSLSGALNIACVSGNTTCTTSGGNTITINTAWNIVTTNLSTQTITKQLILNNLVFGGAVTGNNQNMTGTNYINSTKFFQNGNRVVDTISANSPLSASKSGSSYTLSCSTCLTIDLNTAQIRNVGTANGLGIWVTRDNATQNSLRSITCGANLSCSVNATNFRINATGSSDTNTAQLGDADHASGSSSLIGPRFNATKNTIKTVNSGTGISLSGNTTNLIITNIGVTSLNSTTGAMSINAHDNGTISKISGTTIQIISKDSVVLTNGSAQRISKSLTIQDPEINGLQLSYRSKTSAYTLTTYDIVVSVDATNANPTIITLPTAASPNVNNTFIIKKIDVTPNIVEVKTTSAQTIDGFSNINITNSGQQLTVISDASNWKILQFPYNIGVAKGAGFNRWMDSAIVGQGNATYTPTAGHLYAEPYDIYTTQKIDQIHIAVTTAGASSLCRVGIYNDNGTNFPSTLISGSDVGTLNTASLGIKTNTFGSPITLEGPARYWFAWDCQATTPSLAGIPSTALKPIGEIGTRMGMSNEAIGWDATFAFAALPTVYTATSTDLHNTPGLQVQVRVIG